MTSAWPSPKGHEKISGTSLKHCLTKQRSQRQASLNDSSPLVNFNHAHGQINIRKQKTSQKKGGDKVNNKEKRKDTKVKKRYISENTRTKKIIHTKCNLNFQINIPKKGKDKRQFQLQIANLNFKISSSKHYPKLIFTN
jgi:hypothetical protein